MRKGYRRKIKLSRQPIAFLGGTIYPIRKIISAAESINREETSLDNSWDQYDDWTNESWP